LRPHNCKKNIIFSGEMNDVKTKTKKLLNGSVSPTESRARAKGGDVYRFMSGWGNKRSLKRRGAELRRAQTSCGPSETGWKKKRHTGGYLGEKKNWGGRPTPTDGLVQGEGDFPDKTLPRGGNGDGKMRQSGGRQSLSLEAISVFRTTLEREHSRPPRKGKRHRENLSQKRD